MPVVFYHSLLYGPVSQGLGTTKFANLIGWNGYWPPSRFSHLDRYLDRWCFEVKKLQTKMQNHWLFSSNNIYFCKCQKFYKKKKSKEDEQTLEELNLAIAVRKQNFSYYKPVTLNELNCSCFCHIINIIILINWVGLYGRILTSVVCTDLTASGLYLWPWSRFSHTDHLLG